MYLRPSEIRFSQDSINNVFDKRSSHANRRIGETLDALLKGDCDIGHIPTIKVIKRNGVWFTADNRRLWVFQKLEELGGCTEIPVQQDYYIPSGKLTTVNEGRSISVRRDAGGSYWRNYRPSSIGTSRQNLPSASFGASSMPNPFQFQSNKYVQESSAIPSSSYRPFEEPNVTSNSRGYVQQTFSQPSSPGYASSTYSYAMTAPPLSLPSEYGYEYDSDEYRYEYDSDEYRYEYAIDEYGYECDEYSYGYDFDEYGY